MTSTPTPVTLASGMVVTIGVDAANMGDYLKAGVAGFGIGSSLYKPGMSAAEVGARAKEMVAAYQACVAG